MTSRFRVTPSPRLRAGLALSALCLALGPVLLQPALAGEASAKAKATLQLQVKPSQKLQKGVITSAPKLQKPKDEASLPAVQSPELSGRPGAAVSPQVQRLRELDQARGLKDHKDLPLGAAHLPERSGGLTDIPGSTLGQGGGRKINPLDRLGGQNRGGCENPLGKYAPDLPDNNRGRGRNPLIPSANPQDWIGGAATSDGSKGGKEPGEKGDNSKQASGMTFTTYNDDGSETTRRTYRLPNGGRSVTDHTVRPDRSGFSVTRSYDSSGRNFYTRRIAHDSQGRIISMRSRDDLSRTKDPNADDGSGVALLCYTMPWKCSEIDGVDTGKGTLVNPGPVDAQGGFVPGPRIDPGEIIVTNPPPDEAARRDDWEGARRAAERSMGLPTPHSEPDDPRGER